MSTKYTVVIVGAGPVGLLTALKLGQRGISTLVVEKHSGILDAARAIAYGISSNAVLSLTIWGHADTSVWALGICPSW